MLLFMSHRPKMEDKEEKELWEEAFIIHETRGFPHVIGYSRHVIEPGWAPIHEVDIRCDCFERAYYKKHPESIPNSFIEDDFEDRIV